MKRLGNLYPSIYDYDNIILVHIMKYAETHEMKEELQI